MSEHIPHEYMMIGLHKIAAERGDGLIPELLALYATRRQMTVDAGNVLAFPEELASPTCAHNGSAGIGNDNVIAFQPRLAQKSRLR